MPPLPPTWLVNFVKLFSFSTLMFPALRIIYVILTFDDGSSMLFWPLIMTHRCFFDHWTWLIDVLLSFRFDVLLTFDHDTYIQTNLFFFIWPSLQSRELYIIKFIGTSPKRQKITKFVEHRWVSNNYVQVWSFWWNIQYNVKCWVRNKCKFSCLFEILFYKRLRFCCFTCICNFKALYRNV